MSMPSSLLALARFSARAIGLALVLSPSACFDPEELTEGLQCTQASHCGGSLQCVNGFCVNPSEPDPCDTDPAACNQSSASLSDSLSAGTPADAGGTGADGADSLTTSVSMTAADDSTACADQYESCYDNGGCCNFGLCVNYGNGTATCQEQCNIGTECASCCCIQLETGGNACVDTTYCGQEAQCLGGCASPGAACYGDYDCCGGGRCLLNAGNWYSCFKPCTGPADCVSGCCNYNATIGSNICEAC